MRHVPLLATSSLLLAVIGCGDSGGANTANTTTDAGAGAGGESAAGAAGDGGDGAGGSGPTGGASAGGTAGVSGGGSAGTPAGGTAGTGAGGTSGAAGAGGAVSTSCGDGIVDPSEICDDGNGIAVDSCTNACVQASCGDGIRRRDLAAGAAGAEQCDDGGNVPNDGCTASCQLELPSCGDGTVDTNEGCDLGAGNDDNQPGSCPNVCRTDCSCPHCGDAVPDFALGEQCDDGGTSTGDGCDANCQIEPIATCGNGALDIPQGEECDDGGTANGDGCDDTCQFEPVGATCGDGTVDTLEKCDDNNTTNGDGCNTTCNLTATVTTLATGIDGQLMAADDTSLWITDNVACTIDRIDIDACVNQGTCTPTAVAGSGTCGTTPTDGTGAAAILVNPGAITTDGTTVWFGEAHVVRALDIATGTVTTIAGEQNHCGAIDGTGTSAYFHDIRGLTYYGGYVYLLDACEQVLRRLDPGNGNVVTIAGQRQPDPGIPQTGATAYQCMAGFNCVDGPTNDGYGLAAGFGSPRYMTPDHSGNLYITDTNGERVRSYNLVTGYVGTLVGGTAGYVDGTGGAVQLARPRGIISDGTSLYFGEQNAHTVRQIVINSTDTSTLAGARGCLGTADGTGGDGTQDWSANCGDAAIAALPRFDTPFGAMTYHFPSQSIFMLASGRLTRIE